MLINPSMYLGRYLVIGRSILVALMQELAIAYLDKPQSESHRVQIALGRQVIGLSMLIPLLSFIKALYVVAF